MQRRALLLLLFGFCWAGPVPVPQLLELDTDDSRRVLGSSVVTSVSVIMDLGNGTKAFFADAAGRPVPRPPALSPVGSPVELLSPDRYEFYTFDEFGDLVRRYMTLDQIQSIIASGDGEVRPLPGQLEDYRPSSGTANVGDVIASVQNVLRGAMNASEKPPTRRPPPPRPTKRPGDVPKPTASPSEKPPIVKPANPLPPLKTVTTQPLTTVSETATPAPVQSTSDNMPSTRLPPPKPPKPRPTIAPVNATTMSEITSTSTQSTADSSKTESIGQQSTSTALPTSPVTIISVEITSSEANDTSNVNLPTSSNTSTNEVVDSESAQSAVPTENYAQSEQSSATEINDSSATTQTSTSVSNATSYSTSETTTVTSTQLVYNQSSTVSTTQAASAESSTSNQQESQTTSSVESSVDSQSSEESSLETSTASEKKNETTSTEKSETTDYVTEIFSVQTEPSLNASVQNGTDTFESQNNSASSTTEETAVFESNSNAGLNATSNVTDTSVTAANITEGEDLSLIMEEILDSTFGSTTQDSGEVSSTTLQPENITSSTENVSEETATPPPVQSTTNNMPSTRMPPPKPPKPRPTIAPVNAITMSEITTTNNMPSTRMPPPKPPKPRPTIAPVNAITMSEITSTSTQSTADSSKTESIGQQSVSISQYSAEASPGTYSTEISILTQSTETSNKVLNESAGSSDVYNAPTTEEDIIPTTQSYSVTTVSEIAENNDTQNDVTTTFPMDSYLPQELIDSLSSVMSQVSEDNDEQNLSGLKFSSENISATTLIPEITETTTTLSVMEKLASNSSSMLEVGGDGETTTVTTVETEQTTISSNSGSQETESPVLSESTNPIVNVKENTKQEESTQIDTTTQEVSTNYIAAETTTELSLNSDESDSIQPTTVTSESAGEESLNVSFKSGNTNTSADELSTVAVAEQEFERTTTLAVEAEEQSNIMTTISPLNSNSEGDVKTESPSGFIQTTTVPSKSSDSTTIAETESPPEQTTEIDSLLKLINKGETRISLIEEPSYPVNETQSALYNNDTSNETTENVGLTEAETTTLSTQPVIEETDSSYDNSSDTLYPESKEDSTTLNSVTVQNEIETNATAMYSTTTAGPQNDTIEAEIETTYVSGTKDENVVSKYDASVKETSETLNGTQSYNTSTYNITINEPEGNTTSSSESSTIDQFIESNNGNQSTADISGNNTSVADYSNTSYSVQVTEAPTITTTESLTEQPALKTDFQNGYETSIYEPGFNTSEVSQNYSSESASIENTTTEASQVNAITEATKTGASSSSEVPVENSDEISSKEPALTSSADASTEGSASSPASPISLTAPEIEEPGDNALKDGVEAPAPVDLRPSQNEHLGLEATTASLERGLRRFSDLCNELALRLWAAVAARGATSARSLVMSPFAVTSLLAMVFLGARGPTSAEMNDLLRLDDMVTFNPHLIFRNITETLVHGRTPGIASVAFVRQLYSDKNKGKILDFYKDRAQQFYEGHVEEANFRVIGDLVRRRTNLLVKRQTRGRVPEFIRGPGVALRPPLAAFSANVLQTDCSDASMEGRDGEMYFTVTPSPRERRLIPVPAAVWRQGVYAGYDPQIDATVAALGVDSAVSLIFVAPGQQGNVAPGDGLPQLERRLLTPPAWSRLLRTLLPRPGLELQVPRFSHRSLLNATGALQRLGLRDLMTPGRADLRGLDGLGDLHLADVLAATALTTCAGERGHAEAYPARAARLLDADLSDLPLALRPRQARRPLAPARLRYDKPFFYAVRHNPTGVILHMGRFNPRLQ